MIKKLTVVLLASALCFWFAGVATAEDTGSQTFAAEIDDICVIDVTGNPSTLIIAAPATGGETPSNPADSSRYAQYTSVVDSASSVTRLITAKWGASDAAPAGTSLKLVATPSGGTNEGSAASEITVSSTPQNIVTGIGSCATGTGATDGARLKYTLSLDTMTSLIANDDKTISMTLTLTDAA